MAAASVRLDQLLVERELAESRHKAQALILAGQVLADEQKIDKPGRRVRPDCALRILGERPKFVSRAGVKLEAALERFEIDVTDRICLEVGSSTGGFTDCLLRRGAAKVYCVDSGTNQLDWRLRQDPRVVVRERTNARRLSEAEVPESCSFGCCDVSFISATLILRALLDRLAPEADLVVLVKPQFEVGKGLVGAGGVVRDARLHAAAVERVRTALAALGCRRIEEIESPIEGAEGNKEFLLWASRRVQSA